MAKVNLTQFAEWQGISDRTARRWFKDGTMPYPAEKVGRQIFVDLPDEQSGPGYPQRTALYLVSQRSSPAEPMEWALEHGMRVDETHRESSPTSESTLKQLLANPTITRIIAESHPSADLISAALSASGREFITTKPQTQAPARTFKPRLASSTGA